MEYTKSSVSRIVLVIIGVMIGLLVVGALYSYFDTKNTASQNQQEKQTDYVFPTTSQGQVPTISANPTSGTSLANPASTNCANNGGTTVIQTRGDGGEYGLCDFGSGMMCEEWAMMQGACPVGGIKTTGYDNVQQKYCAWSGGSTLAEPNATCTFKNGKSCSVDSYYNGTCQAN